MSKYQNYGNVKMRGRKHKLLSCGCCEAVNKRKILKDHHTGILRGAEAMAREIDLEVLESLKKFDWEETVKNINDPLRKN